MFVCLAMPCEVVGSSEPPAPARAAQEPFLAAGEGAGTALTLLPLPC